MSANPQWNASLYSPKSPAASSLHGFNYNGGSNGGSGNLISSGANGSNGFNNFPSFNRSSSSSGNFFSQNNQPSNQFPANNQGGSVSPPLGSSSIGHFHIGTFNANSVFSGEEPVKPAAAHLGNGNLHREGGTNSPNNQGSRETGIIEKLLVSSAKSRMSVQQSLNEFHFVAFLWIHPVLRTPGPSVFPF